MTGPEAPGPTPQEVELIETRLHDAARGVSLPSTSVREHLTRGRRRVRRRRLATAGAAVATVVAVAVGAALVGPSDRDGAPVASSEPDRAVDPTAPPSPTGSPTPSVSPSASITPSDTRPDEELLQAYRDVIAEYVDPTGQHLQRVPDNQQSGGGLGTKLGWSNAGEEGLGVIEVFVSDSWADQWYLWCDDTQDCRDLTVGDIDARVLREDGTTWVGVQRADGSVAVLSVSTLFGNNSTVPVSDIDVSVGDLARIAADERLVLRGGR